MAIEDRNKLVLKVAAHAGCDMRTALRAIENGISTIKGESLRERLAAAFKELGIKPKVAK